ARRDPGGRHVPLVVRPLGRLPGRPATTAADPRSSPGDDCREPAGGGRERALLPCRLGHHPERRGDEPLPVQWREAAAHGRPHRPPPAVVPRWHRAAQRTGHAARRDATDSGTLAGRGAHRRRRRTVAALLRAARPRAWRERAIRRAGIRRPPCRLRGGCYLSLHGNYWLIRPYDVWGRCGVLEVS